MKQGILLLIVSFFYLENTFAQDQTAEIIKIGVIQSLTGIASEDGKTTAQALRLAAEEINSSGKTKVNLLIEDDQTLPKNTVSAFQKLKNENVDVVIGATWSFTSNAIVPLAVQNKIVLLNTSTLADSINLKEGNGFAFSNATNAIEHAKMFESYLKKNQIKKVLVVYTNNAWGEVQRKAYLEVAKKLGIEIVDELKSVALDSNEWSAMIPRVKGKNAELLLLLLNKGDLEVFIKKAKEQGVTTKFFSSYHLYDSYKMATSKEIYNGICFPYPLERLNRESDFIRKYQAKYGEEPRIFADNSYDAVFLIVKAKELAIKQGITFSEAIKKVEYDGLAGHYRYSEQTSLCTGQTSLACIENGKVQ